ncbi:helix-turn-helix transcriptional regulator [Rhodopseudomonas boonkerdii]|uniref:helix-turn-helix transcriptional regulator n=1 Tax=Rhodopseudomonas boonkerdii TaxID=475937 RepID=UPI001E34B81C|nr:AraC family transcriptional regulator [Rhodopseudomonas boonkerdii]
MTKRHHSRALSCSDSAPDCPLVPLWLIADDIDEYARKPLEARLPWKAVHRDSLGSFRAAPFQSKAILQMQPDLGLMSCFDPAQRWMLPNASPEEMARDAGKHVLIVRPSDGVVIVEQNGQRRTCMQREAIVLDASAAATFVMHDVGRIDCLSMTRDVRTDMRHIAHDNSGLIALGHYAAAIMRGLLPMNSAALTDLAVDHMSGLVNAMIAEADAPTRPNGQPRDRAGISLLALKADIEAGLGQPSLSLEQLASSYGVTTRYFQKLFEAEGRTFSDYLLERRLERAFQMLRDGNRMDRTVSTIAFEVGFGDLSYFNRTFKKRFNATPREIRARFDVVRLAALAPGTSA